MKGKLIIENGREIELDIINMQFPNDMLNKEGKLLPGKYKDEKGIVIMIVNREITIIKWTDYYEDKD